MARVKGGVTAHARHKKVIKQSKGSFVYLKLATEVSKTEHFGGLFSQPLIR